MEYQHIYSDIKNFINFEWSVLMLQTSAVPVDIAVSTNALLLEWMPKVFLIYLWDLLKYHGLFSIIMREMLTVFFPFYLLTEFFVLAIQNDRDRIGPTKKMKLSNQNLEDGYAIHIRSIEERVKHFHLLWSIFPYLLNIFSNLDLFKAGVTDWWIIFAVDRAFIGDWKVMYEIAAVCTPWNQWAERSRLWTFTC